MKGKIIVHYHPTSSTETNMGHIAFDGNVSQWRNVPGNNVGKGFLIVNNNGYAIGIVLLGTKPSNYNEISNFMYGN